MKIAENLKQVEARITDAATEAGRSAGDVTLIAVSKTQPMDKITAALEAGQRVFGENRVQEGYAHWQDIRAQGDYPDLQLHLIGPLQTNKVADAVALFDVIHSVDREKLARKLSSEMKKQGRSLACLVQVNTGEEAQKAGISPAELAEFLDFCRGECGLDITGLMCIPPVDEPPELHFALLSSLAQKHGLTQLSMGMSEDFEAAIRLGATYVRVGTGIFGARDYDGV